MKEKSKNAAAVALGKLAAGIPKHFSAAERARRAAAMRSLNAQRRKRK